MKLLSELIGPPTLALLFAVPMGFMGPLILPALGIGLVGLVWLVVALVWYSSRAPGTAAIYKLDEELAGALKGRCPHCRKEVVVRAALPDQPSVCPACGKPV